MILVKKLQIKMFGLICLVLICFSFSCVVKAAKPEERNSKHAKLISKQDKKEKSVKGGVKVENVEIIKLTITDYPAWNSSYQRQQLKTPETVPQVFTLTSDNEEFAALSRKVMEQSKINKEHLMKDYFLNKIEVVKRNEPNRPQSKGATPARTTFLIEFSNSQIFKLGQHPFYEVSEPFFELVELTRTKGEHTLEY